MGNMETAFRKFQILEDLEDKEPGVSNKYIARKQKVLES